MTDKPWAVLVETPRLQLREFTSSDIISFYELESLPEVVRYQDWGPRTMDEATKVVEDTIHSRMHSPRTVVELAVIERAEHRFIGRVGGFIVYEEEKVNLWFSFMPQSQGRGFASEAMEALISELKDSFGVGRCEIECDPRNTKSRGLAERLGFVKVKEEEDVYVSKGERVGSVVYSKLIR